MNSYTDEQVLEAASRMEKLADPVRHLGDETGWITDDVAKMLRQLHAKCHRLQAEVEALRQDAERYRWIRNDDIGAAERAILISDYGIPEVRTGASLDESIDNARSTPHKTKEAKS